MYLKIANFTGKTHVFESLFKKASGPQAYKFIRDSNTGIFLRNWQDFQTLSITEQLR